MNEIIQNIMDTVDKKGIQSNCKKILKKCSMKSAKDTGLITELAIWKLYIMGQYRPCLVSESQNSQRTGRFE